MDTYPALPMIRMIRSSSRDQSSSQCFPDLTSELLCLWEEGTGRRLLGDTLYLLASLYEIVVVISNLIDPKVHCLVRAQSLQGVEKRVNDR